MPLYSAKKICSGNSQTIREVWKSSGAGQKQLQSINLRKLLFFLVMTFISAFGLFA